MKRQKHSNNNRSNYGQAIAEMVPALTVLVFLALGSLLLLINFTAIASRKAITDVVAGEAAKAVLADRYFLGMQRRQFDLTKSSNRARAIADELLMKAGLGKTTNFKVIPYYSVALPTSGQIVDIVRIDLSASVVPTSPGFKFLNATVIPNFVTISSSGISTNAAETKSNGLGIITMYNIDHPKRSHAFFLPIYNAEVVNGNVEAGDHSYSGFGGVATGPNDSNYGGWSLGDPAGVTSRGRIKNCRGTVMATVGINDNCAATTQGTWCASADGTSKPFYCQ